MFRNVMADSMLVGLNLAFLWHFSNIWRYGQYLAQEPNIIIRSLETAMLFFIFAFGVSRLVADFRRQIWRALPGETEVLGVFSS
jgi:hypothetical protein